MVRKASPLESFSGKGIRPCASQETGPLCPSPRSEGDGGIHELSPAAEAPHLSFRQYSSFAFTSHAVTVHGTVSDTVGRPVSDATVALVQNGKVVLNTTSHADGTYQLSS